jgi:glycosyltransferase involved in cell wall biosynthesis/GT2 family glycosyltransferase
MNDFLYRSVSSRAPSKQSAIGEKTAYREQEAAAQISQSQKSEASVKAEGVFPQVSQMIDEGGLSSSLENLARPPRLRGDLKLAFGRLSGWLIDARSPGSGLEIALFFDGRKIASTAIAEQVPRGSVVDPRYFRFALSWTKDVPTARLIAVHVVCVDGERYQLFIAGSELQLGRAPAMGDGKDVQELVFGPENRRSSPPRSETQQKVNLIAPFVAGSELQLGGATAIEHAKDVQELVFGSENRRSSLPRSETQQKLNPIDSARSGEQAPGRSSALTGVEANPSVAERAPHDVRTGTTTALPSGTKLAQSASRAETQGPPPPTQPTARQVEGKAAGKASEEAGAIRAYVDALRPTMISGWAWDENNPDATVELLVLHKQKKVAQGPANNLRQDLKDAGVGTGRYGFVFSLPSCDPRDVSIQAKQGSATVNVEIPAEFLKGPPRLEPSVAAKLTKLTFEGHVDRVTRWGAVGWAWLPQRPKEAAIVEALHEGVVIGRAVANRMREDLVAHRVGTGKYGFDLSFDHPIENDTAPEFRILEPAFGSLTNTNPLPARSQSERKIQGRGNVEDLYVEHAKFTAPGDEFEEFDSSILESVDRSQLDVIAYYLPQFHPIKENDRFWGKGFTEWRQLSRGLPRYRGHYQPRIPRDLGFYTLTDVAPITRQAALAKAAGVNVFGFYYYWFNRARVLDEPMEVFLRSGVEMKFMLIWANENWTRTWDGSESDVLLKQEYSEGDERALIADWVRHFQDRRYYTISDRPLFVIYNPKLIPDAQKTIARWRQILETEHDMNPLIFMAQTFGMRDPTVFGLDGAIEFPPHKLSDTLPGRPMPDTYSPEFAGQVIDYDEFVRVSLAEEAPNYALIKTAVPSWDNEARRPNRGFSLELSTPKKFENWLSGLINRALTGQKTGGSRGRAVIAVNAWNEWAEGAYLEPDVHFGAAYLNATARAIRSSFHALAKVPISASAASLPAVSVIFPNYNHTKFLPERISSVLNQTMKPAEIIFLDDCSSDDSVEIARDLLTKSRIPHRIVVNEKNSGGVFRQWMKGLSLARYELVWVAETDDSVDRHFLSNILPAFVREDVMAAFGRIISIDPDGAPRGDLDNYFDDLKDFSWSYSCVVPAYQAFSNDFAIKNVIPNASGLVFRKPMLTAEEQARLFQYRFAGDWYFYALVARGGAVAYCHRACSYFRANQTSASRSSFFTGRHLAEHQMVIQDLSREYGVGEAVVRAHSDALAQYFTDRSPEALRQALRNAADESDCRQMRICVAANGFAIGGGEILPAELANKLKALGLHVTYLVIERPKDARDNTVRKRLRNDIPVVYWDDICDDLPGFVAKYGIQLINSHNVSVDFRVFLRDLRLNIPYVVSLHGGYETVPSLLTPEFLSYLSKNVSKWLYLSEKNIEFLPIEEKNDQKLLYSFNAVPDYADEWIDRSAFRQQHAIAANAFVFVQCSRAIEAKGWRTSIQIVERLSTSMERPVHLVLIGDGPIAADLQKECADSRLVTFLGQVDTPVRYFKCFDLGLYPTTFEGETFPLFLLECFLAGLPAISTDIGEIPRIMEGVDGCRPGMVVDYRSPPEKLVSEFSAKLEEMFNTFGTHQSLVKGALATSKRFSMDQLATLYERVMRELILDAKQCVAP